MFGHLEYLLDGAGLLIGVSGPLEDIFNSDLGI